MVWILTQAVNYFGRERVAGDDRFAGRGALAGGCLIDVGHATQRSAPRIFVLRRIA